MKESGKAIEVDRLSKTYSGARADLRSSTQLLKFFSVLKGDSRRDVLALNQVNLTVRQGEIFGLLGPNGAGKTTLIKILSTLVLPDSGRALVNGVDVVKHPRRTVRMLQSVLAEGIGFERRLTGRQNLLFYSVLYGIPSDVARRRIAEVLELCGLTSKADLMFQRYSTGMARKLLVSRALLSDASVLLFDEPTASLDPVSAADFRKFMTNLARQMGKTVLLATHNLWEAQQVCDRMALLHKGRIVSIGSPTEMRQTVADRVYLNMRLTCADGLSSSILAERLRSIEGVLSSEVTEDGPYGNPSLRVEGTKDVNYTGVFQMLSELNYRILSLETSQPSLEEAFIKLTTGATS